MLLSTIICPQYLRGWGSGVVFVYAHHPCRSPRRPPSHLCASSSSTSSHTARRETATSSRYSYALTPNAHIPWQKALLLYYLIVILERNTLYFSTLDALYMNPKGSQAFHFHIWSPSWTNLGHVLDISALNANKQASVLLSALSTLRPRNEPCNRKYTPYFAPKCRFSSLAQVTKNSQIPLSGLQCKKSDFLNTFSGLPPRIFRDQGQN